MQKNRRLTGYFSTPSPAPKTDEQLSSAARAKRDALIAETDYLLMPDYPIIAENWC